MHNEYRCVKWLLCYSMSQCILHVQLLGYNKVQIAFSLKKFSTWIKTINKVITNMAAAFLAAQYPAGNSVCCTDIKVNNAVVRYGTAGNSVCCTDIKVNNAVVRYGTAGNSVCCTDTKVNNAVVRYGTAGNSVCCTDTKVNNAVVRYGTAGNYVCCTDIKVNNAVVRYGTAGNSVCCTDIKVNNAVVRYGTAGNYVCCTDIKVNNAVVRYGTAGNSVCCTDIKVNNAVVRYGTAGNYVCCTDIKVNNAVVRYGTAGNSVCCTDIKVNNAVVRYGMAHSGEIDEANCSWLHPVWPPPKQLDQDITFCAVSRASTELIFCIHRDCDVRNNMYKPCRSVCECYGDISAWKSWVMKPTVLGDEANFWGAIAWDEANWVRMKPTPHLRRASEHNIWLLIFGYTSIIW